MGRLPRSDLSGVTPYFHIICRGNNHGVLFRDEEDFGVFRMYLKKYCDRWGLQIFHYVLMTTHVHIEVHIDNVSHMSSALHGTQMIYCRYFHKKYSSIGHLWHSRYRAVPIISEKHLLRCGRYIENNPTTAEMTPHPSAYSWSSYHFYADGRSDPLITVNPMYESMGSELKERQLAYKEFIEEGLKQERHEEQRIFEPFSHEMTAHRRTKRLRWI